MNGGEVWLEGSWYESGCEESEPGAWYTEGHKA